MSSFIFDFSAIFNFAASFANGIFPVYAIPLGIALAVGILGFIVAAFNKVFRGG